MTCCKTSVVGCGHGYLSCCSCSGCGCCDGLDGEGIRAAGAATGGGRTVKPFVCTRGRGCADSARGVVLGTNGARCPAGSTGVVGDCCFCGVFLPEPSSPDASSKGVAAPLSLSIHSSSSSLPTVDAAMVKPALGFPPRDGSGFVTARRGAALGTCSRDCTRTVLPVRKTFARGAGSKVWLVRLALSILGWTGSF